MACSLSFHFLQATTSQNVFTCQFIINQLLQRIAMPLKNGTAFWITRRGKWYYKIEQVLPNGANFIKKWVNSYEVMQYIANERNKGKRLYVTVMSRTSFKVNPHSIVCPECQGTSCSRSLSDRHRIRTHNHLVRKRTLNHLAKLVVGSNPFAAP